MIDPDLQLRKNGISTRVDWDLLWNMQSARKEVWTKETEEQRGSLL
jgi:hypothetical protein